MIRYTSLYCIIPKIPRVRVVRTLETIPSSLEGVLAWYRVGFPC